MSLISPTGAFAAICGVLLSSQSSPLSSMDYYVVPRPGTVYEYEQTIIEAPASFPRRAPTHVWSQYLSTTTHAGKTLLKFRSAHQELGSDRPASVTESYTAPFEIQNTETEPRFGDSYKQGTEDGKPVGVSDNSVFLANLPIGSRGRYFIVNTLRNHLGPVGQVISQVDYTVTSLGEIQTTAGTFRNVKQVEVKYTTAVPGGKAHVHHTFERYAKGVGYVQSESFVDVDVPGGSGAERGVMRSIYQLVKMPYYSANPIEPAQ